MGAQGGIAEHSVAELFEGVVVALRLAARVAHVGVRIGGMLGVRSGSGQLREQRIELGSTTRGQGSGDPGHQLHLLASQVQAAPAGAVGGFGEVPIRV